MRNAVLKLISIDPNPPQILACQQDPVLTVFRSVRLLNSSDDVLITLSCEDLAEAQIFVQKAGSERQVSSHATKVTGKARFS
jgi:hypothetical protein